jgi:hypothetical protein
MSEREEGPHFTAMSIAIAWDMKRAVAVMTTWSWHCARRTCRNFQLIPTESAADFSMRNYLRILVRKK